MTEYRIIVCKKKKKKCSSPQDEINTAFNFRYCPEDYVPTITFSRNTFGLGNFSDIIILHS